MLPFRLQPFASGALATTLLLRGLGLAAAAGAAAPVLLPAVTAVAAQAGGSDPGRSEGFDAEAFVLNGLLVPSFDPDVEPLRWADPRSRAACDPDSEVQMDGRPLPVGEPVPSGLFVVDWTARHCRPFGPGGPRLHGKVRLIIERRGDRLEAQVIPHDMVVEAAGALARPLSVRRAAIDVGVGVQP